MIKFFALIAEIERDFARKRAQERIDNLTPEQRANIDRNRILDEPVV
ncbi:hypothetical protein CAXC1_260061 [Candidatus Xenohaliotis californiensis]|uniref:Uncharacterized protein n=2 Tax=Candidatus Xenohaliotis californiensis TaxID=84677 RepID=A0ABP0EST2_9RICK|nr:hypothetical protein CAXC1_260061 [Candidatus Xenohaliotis californiensis]